jgi:DNA-binding response OmpR family regulator
VEFITKPFDMEDVLDTVREVLERFGGEAQPTRLPDLAPGLLDLGIEGIEPA